MDKKPIIVIDDDDDDLELILSQSSFYPLSHFFFAGQLARTGLDFFRHGPPQLCLKKTDNKNRLLFLPFLFPFPPLCLFCRSVRWYSWGGLMPEKIPWPKDTKKGFSKERALLDKHFINKLIF